MRRTGAAAAGAGADASGMAVEGVSSPPRVTPEPRKRDGFAGCSSSAATGRLVCLLNC